MRMRSHSPASENKNQNPDYHQKPDQKDDPNSSADELKQLYLRILLHGPMPTNGKTPVRDTDEWLRMRSVPDPLWGEHPFL